MNRIIADYCEAGREPLIITHRGASASDDHDAQAKAWIDAAPYPQARWVLSVSGPDTSTNHATAGEP